MTVRTNLIKNPSFEVDLTGYSTQGASATITRDTTLSYTRAASVHCVNTASNYRVLVWGATGAAAANADSIATSAGQSWSFSCYAQVTSTSANLTPKIHCFNSSGSWISDIQGSTVNVTTAGGWTRLTVSGTTPANTAKIGVCIVAAATYTGNIDGLLLENTGTVGSYFDGASTNTGFTYAWTGTADASTSTETPVSGQTASGTQTATGAAVGKVALNPKQSALGTAAGKLGYAVRQSGTGSAVGKLGLAGRPSASGTSSGGSLGLYALQTATGAAAGAPHGQASGTPSAVGTASGAVTLGASQSAVAGTTTKLALNPVQTAAGGPSGSQGRVATQTAVGTATGVPYNLHNQSETQTATGTAFGVVVLPTEGVQSAVGAVYTELFYDKPPAPLDEQPLQKLSDFSVSTAAVPVNPAQGVGQAATVSATFTAGPDPEQTLGTTVYFRNGAIGEWSGEASRVKTTEGSGRVSLTVDTPVTKLDAQLRLFPHIPASASTATAGEAVDYWTQQAGLFYDDVDGEVAFYQSGYGHPYAYGSDLGSTKLYEKSYTPLYRTGRTALTFGALSQCAMFEDDKARVPVSVGSHRKLVLSTALTAGAAGTVRFVFDGLPSLALTVASGTVTAYCGAQALASAPITGEGRAWASLEKISTTTWAVRVTTSTGGDSGIQLQAVPFSAYSKLLRAEFEGTAGARYGTYLAVADTHPTTVPDEQKDLQPTNKALAFVPGFEGTVWDRLGEFCSVNRLDVSFENKKLTLRPRSSALVFPATFARLERTWERKLKYRQVAVVDQKSVPNRTSDGLLYKADTVHQVSAREVFETTVQTKHSILSVQNPVCVTGIEPFPYKGGNGATGQYVVTGADGYIVSPQWWADNGGKVEVFLTENEGEIKLRITAPWPDSVRAPYRISEGAGDRPALYVVGSGILNDPVERHVSTGAKHAREGFERVFDSPFCGTPDQVYAAAMGMAGEYSAAAAQYDFELPNDWDTPTGLGQFPAGTVFPDQGRNARVLDAQQTAHSVTGTAAAFTTYGMSKAARPTGAKYGDRIKGRTYRERNINPLKRSA